jgi:hypothetical protein
MKRAFAYRRSCLVVVFLTSVDLWLAAVLPPGSALLLQLSVLMSQEQAPLE